jgi:hypothetical protein
LGWPLLKLYYAAFFAAHSIMRATGGGILRVEPAQARQLADLATLYGANIGVTAGTFEMRLSQLDDRSLGVKLTRISEGGGAHDQLWRRFNAFLSNVSDEAVQNSEPAASDIARDVMELQSVMQSNGLTAGTWLSSVRNQINYQQQHGVWFPYGASAPVVQAVRRLSIRETESIRRDYNPSKEPILAFGSTCHLIVSIASQLAVSAASRIKSRRFSGLWRRVNSTPNKTPS